MKKRYGDPGKLNDLKGKKVINVEMLLDVGCLTLDFDDGSTLVYETHLSKGSRIALKNSGKPVIDLEN